LVAAQTDDGQIMAVSHKKFNVHGVQFHPESIASQYGAEVIANFIRGI
jgi:anthranilate synthase component 2